ncbi:MAG: molecular chaperone [Endomicrobiia bacterium]
MMSTDSVLHNRMLKYKLFSVSLSYPDEKNFSKLFLEDAFKIEVLHREYDTLFRAKGISLYAAEYLAENEFQRANYLSDIMGFYNAFGLQTNNERPDAIFIELEFMHYLIFKEINAPDKEKVLTCFSAEKKFFNEYIYSPAKEIAKAIISQSKNRFYSEIAKSLLDFIEEEKRYYE